MKRLLYFIIPALALLFAGCTGEPESPFDKSASERVQEAIDEINGILLDSENGWIMRYYPNTASYGGFNLHIKFNDNKIAEITQLEEIMGMPEDVRSTQGEYQVNAEESVLLTFDTSNNALHYFILRTSGGMGLLADFEFLPKTWNENHLSLKGKNYGMSVELIKLQDGETAGSYKAKIYQNIGNMMYAGYKLKAGDNTYRVLPDYNQRQIAYIDGPNVIRIPYIFTPEGLKFYSPVNIGGTEVSELNWDGNGKFGNAQGSISLEQYIPSGYDLLIDRVWYFTAGAGTMSTSFKTEWDKAGNPNIPQLFYFTMDETLAPQIVSTILWNNGVIYTINIKYDLTLLDGGTKVNMKYRSLGGSEVVYREGKYPSIFNTFFALPLPAAARPMPEDSEAEAKKTDYKGRTYVITVDDATNPKTLTFTADNDSDYWFRVMSDKANIVTN